MSKATDVFCALCDYEGPSHEVGSHQCIVGTLRKIKGAEADANQLAGQLTSAMLCYHIMAKHGGSTDDCTAQTCRDYREALRNHRESRAGN